jgi:cytochrome c-type biogenesis protein CcmE
MTARRKRLFIVLAILAGVSVAAVLVLQSFRQNMMLFYDPSQVVAFRLGGMVTEGSVKRDPGSLEVRFVVTDFKHSVLVSYTGVLPDLFKDGQGIIAHGRLAANGLFVADEVLAKHDENYMPPEVAESLKAKPPQPETT